jgi:hypothetical protein
MVEANVIFIQGVPEPLRAKVWQMLVGLEDSNYLVESYKDLIRRVSTKPVFH